MLNHFVRLRATGRDRAKFLHNFCTNNIKAMEPGTACEAFFTDVKARVLAHGYVLAFDDMHEIWIRPGDPELLLKHLNRYIITEDVTIVGDPSVSSTTSVSTVSFPVTEELLSLLPLHKLTSSVLTLTELNRRPTAIRLEQSSHKDATSVSGLIVRWAQQLLLTLQGPELILHQFSSAVHQSGIHAFTADQVEALRILERYPVIGLDMTGDNLAPEAERNVKAISYTKGCYLGQEPIARLDAMGHVNRALRVIEIAGQCSADQLIGCIVKNADDQVVGTVSSAVNPEPGRILALSMVRLSASANELHISTPSGQTLTASVLPIDTSDR
jgi:folate-binding protein YgfZ